MNLLNDVRSGLDQQVNAILAAEVVALDVQRQGLDGGPHRPVEDEQSSVKFLENAASHGRIVPPDGLSFNTLSG